MHTQSTLALKSALDLSASCVEMSATAWSPATTTLAEVHARHSNIMQALASGECPALHVRGFYNSAHCRRIVERLTGGGDTISHFQYPMFDGKVLEVKKVGPFLMQYLAAPERYFAEARSTDELFAQVFDGLPDPRASVRDFIASLLPHKRIAVAEERGQRYSSAVVRVHADGDGAPVHRDKALADAAGWQVARFTTQLSALVCLQRPQSGGELVMYRRLWTAEDEAMKARGTLGYPRQLVQGVESCSISAREGDLYIINPSLFHEIRPARGPRRRMTLGTFFGFSPNDPDALFWS